MNWGKYIWLFGLECQSIRGKKSEGILDEEEDWMDRNV
jgi:hypothetical protein